MPDTPETTKRTPQDYRNAPSGTGPLAAEWADKPHRLVYDMAAEIERLRGALGKVAKQWPCADAAAMSRLAREALGENWRDA